MMFEEPIPGQLEINLYMEYYKYDLEYEIKQRRLRVRKWSDDEL